MINSCELANGTIAPSLIEKFVAELSSNPSLMLFSGMLNWVSAVEPSSDVARTVTVTEELDSKSRASGT